MSPLMAVSKLTPLRHLTKAEIRVVRLLADGLTIEEIAQRTGRSVVTIKNRLKDSYRRLGIGVRSDEEPPLSPQIRVYLYAFEQRLRAKTDEELLVARRIMDRAAEDSGEPWLQLHRQGERCVLDMLVEVARRNGRLS